MSTPLPVSSATVVWKTSPTLWGLIALSLLAAVGAFFPALHFMVATWDQVPEFGYGYFIPFVSAYLIWQCSDRLRLRDSNGSWSGLWLVLAGLLLGLLGALSAIRMTSQYGFVLALFGIAVTWLGWQGTRIIAAPLAMLVFMIPLPQFLLREMSEQLQLWSSQLGVGLIRLFDISVFLEGNVIDLGTMKLQVVEACSGLRYLFPLLVLGVIAAYLFRAPLWKRAVLVLSTIPMTILINSLRIGLIGVTVDRWGPAMAEGLLHDFEGFAMFMLCIVLLGAEMALLTRVGGRRGSLREAFDVDGPPAPPAGARVAFRSVPLSAVGAGLLVAAVALVLAFQPTREQTRPPRTAFSEFPLQLPGGWRGRTDTLPPDIVAWLATDDYLLADFTRPDTPGVNLYSAYYATQSGGGSAHSPRTCIPGDGWAITTLAETTVPAGADTLKVNRAIIERAGQRQLVYYWFDERGRNLTDELQVKWYILRDGIVRNRSDGALVRLVTPIQGSEGEAGADRRLSEFLAVVQARLPAFLPR
jgi:exosortase D (VPLPA-CTERM-specific)